MSCQQWHKDNAKKTRFRFSEVERIKAIKDFFNVLCENTATTEEELWETLHSVLCYDSERFKSCSVRLLKDHILDQVPKYKKYDSEEATESGKERLKSEWADSWKLLLTVWCNYEKIVKQAERKTCKGGRPKKVGKCEETELAAAKAIREAALQPVEETWELQGNENLEEIFVEEVEVEVTDVGSPESPHSSSSATLHNYARPSGSTNNSPKRKHTENAVKKRGRSNTEVFTFLVQKQKAEQLEKENELNFKKQQHADSMKLQEKELAYKKAKLDFEERKWKEQNEDREIERNRNVMMNSLIEKLLLGNLNKI